MTAPAVLTLTTVVRGTSWTPTYQLKSGGVVLDLSLGTVKVTLRIRPRHSSGAATTRSSDQAGETAWVTDGTDGKVRFLFDAAATLALGAGPHDLELVYENTAPTPDTKTLHARGTVTVEEPQTGAL